MYQELKRRGELTVRVFARPTMDKWESCAHVGIRHGFGDDWIRIGALKGFVDGIMGNSTRALLRAVADSGERGRVAHDDDRAAGNMERLLFGADSAGYWPHVHAIGDQAIDTLLTMMER